MARFCTRCGKRLEDGEVCTCSQQSIPNQPMQTGSNPNQQAAAGMGQQAGPGMNQQYRQPGPGMEQQAGSNMNQQYRQPGPGMGQQATPNRNPGYGQVPPNPGQYRQYQQYQRRNGGIQGADVATEAKNVVAKALELFKRPITAAKQFTTPNSNMGIELIGAKLVLSLIIVIVITAVLFGKINNLAGGYMMKIGVEAPYFKLIFITLLMTAGFDFLDALLLKIFSKSQRLNYKCMTINVSVRVVYEFIGIAIGGLFLILSVAMLSMLMLRIGIIIFAGVGMITTYVQFAAYYSVVDNREDSKAFRYVLSKAILTVTSSLITYLIIRDVVNNLAGSLSSVIGNFGLF